MLRHLDDRHRCTHCGKWRESHGGVAMACFGDMGTVFTPASNDQQPAATPEPAEQLTGVIRDALTGVAEELRDGEPASDAAKKADEVLWEGEIDGELYRVLSRGQEPDGPMVVRHDSRSDHPQWSATDDDGDYADNWNVAGALATLLRDSLAREGEERRACELGVVLVEKAVTQHIESLTKLAAAERRASEAEARAAEIEAALRLVAPYELELDGRGLCWCTLSPRLKRKHGRPIDEHDSACSRARSVLGIDNKPAKEPTT